MIIFVRQIRPEDSEIFSKWYVKSPSFDPEVLKSSYTLCAFKRGKILGFMIIEPRIDFQILNCFVPNPESTELEKTSTTRELFKTAVSLGYTSNKDSIIFVGDNPGTNRIAEHYFTKTSELINNYPVYKLSLKDLEG